MRHLLHAPHRLKFCIGAGNLLLAMGWWAAWLAAARGPAAFSMAQPAQYAGWLHAFVMQYQVLASFVFGSVAPSLLVSEPRTMASASPVGVSQFSSQT